MSMEDVLETQRSRLRTRVDRAHIDGFIRTLQETFDASKHEAELQLGGSVAKKTTTHEDYDVDIFIKFNTKHRGQPLSDYTEEILNEINIPYKRLHGSRDYFVIEREREYELVPVLHVTKPKQAETVVDMSPLHVTYFNQHADNEQRDEVRLLKQFLKAHSIYGAESYIGGFSGHIVDLLLLHYGDFLGVLRAAQDWEPKVVIDTENHVKNPLLELNESKISGPLILVDPVQPTRNAAAALTDHAFQTFKEAAKTFLENPSADAFEVPTLKEKLRVDKPRGAVRRVIQFDFTDKKKDISGAKLVKIQNHITRHLKNAGFTIHETKLHHEDKSALILVVSEAPENKLIQNGPPVELEDHAKDFKAQHADVWEEDGKLYAEDPHPYRDVDKALQDILTHRYITERCSRLTLQSP